MITQQQLEIRRSAIGGSDAAAVCGKDPYCTPVKKYLEKLGIIDDEEAKFGTPLYWGHLLEDSVAKAYEDFTGIKVRRSNNTLYHNKHDFIICHLDRKVVGHKKILECKTSNSFSAPIWGESGTEYAPFNYIIQVQHQMAITDYEEADIAVIIGGNDFRMYNIKRDEDVINKIIELENKFWHENILPQIPPEPICMEDVKRLYAVDNGEAIDATDEIAEAVNDLTRLQAESKLNDKQQETLKDKITLFMRDAAVLQYYGKSIVTWKADKNGKRQLRIKL